MQALVTGCAGFIGSRLTETLLEQGVAVRGVDAFTTYYDPTVKHRNLAAARVVALQVFGGTRGISTKSTFLTCSTGWMSSITSPGSRACECRGRTVSHSM